MEFYSALKGKEFLIHAATQMNLVDFMPNEIRQSHTHTKSYGSTYIYEVPTIVTIMETENRMVIARS